MWRLEPCVLQNVLILQKQMRCVSFDPSSFSNLLLPINRWPATKMDWFMLPVAESTQKTILTKARSSRTGKFSVTDNFISGNTGTSQGQQMGATGSSISWQAQEMFSKASLVHLGSTSSSKDRKIHFAKILCPSYYQKVINDGRFWDDICWARLHVKIVGY